MPSYSFGTPPFTTTTFTSPFAGTDDGITAQGNKDFTINGNGGNDKVVSGGGNDTITTTSGNDLIRAGDGNNTVNAGDGTNIVKSGTGNDTITTGSGVDEIEAGDGNNTVDAGDGTNTVTTGAGNDTITTGAGQDLIKAGSGDDIITAGAGADRITAGDGDDSVNAGEGDDWINAGGGTDSLIGGGGHDTFAYRSLADAVSGADTISDFNTSNPGLEGEGDILHLSRLVNDFANAPSGTTLAKLVASGHLSFSGDSETTVISFDSNGNSAGGSIGTLVTLVGVAFTTEGDAVMAFNDNVLI
ncbi:MAG: calcium-binding protein [Pseudomonadota bacterium]